MSKRRHVSTVFYGLKMSLNLYTYPSQEILLHAENRYADIKKGLVQLEYNYLNLYCTYLGTT